jgi:hypothetical protein
LERFANFFWIQGDSEFEKILSVARMVGKIFLYFIVIPMLVFIVAEMSIPLLAPKIFGSEVLQGYSGYVLYYRAMTLFIGTVPYYWIFLLLFCVIGNRVLRIVVCGIWFLLPVFAIDTRTLHDFKVDLCESAYFILYYLLFFSLRYLVNFNWRKRLYLTPKKSSAADE